VLEHRSAVLGNVFVEQDARLSIAQQPRQGGFAVEERAIPQILAVVFDKVEGVEDRLMRGVPSAQILEPRQAVWAQHHRFAVDREALSLDVLGGKCDRR